MSMQQPDSVLITGRYRILVVDDEVHILRLFCRILSSMGSLLSRLPHGGGGKAGANDLDVVCCQQAEEAVQAVSQAVQEGDPFALAFVDVRLPPGPDGIWAAGKIRDGDPNVNIVIVTGQSIGDLTKLGEAVGPADKLLYLHKPFHPHEIKHLTAACIARWDLEAAIRSDQARLELLVEQRTNDLKVANGLLREDIERREAVEADLKSSEERYALAARGANDGLWDWNLEQDSLYCSERWHDILGRTADGQVTHSDQLFALLHPDDLLAFTKAVEEHLEGRTDHFECEHRLHHFDGSYRWVLTRGLASRRADGKPARFSGSLTDITLRKQAEERLVYEAHYDSLTGLSNRQIFLQRLSQTLTHCRRYENRFFAVIFLDLDHFKLVNDSLGHQAGDRLLQEVAERLQCCLRATDTVARFGFEHTMARMGGDEFTILLEQLQDPRDAIRVADRVRQALAEPFEFASHEVFTSASMGITLGPAGYGSPDQLLRDADTAMYRAKSEGRGGYTIFDEQMHQHAIEALALETELRRAASVCDFRMVYQPIVSLPEGRIVALEALLRWDSPSRGPVSPAEFIPIAEETGLIHPIGDWVLQAVARQLQAWRERFSFCPPVSVNISSRQLQQRGFLDGVKTVLASTGARRGQLNFEITESVFLAHTELTEQNLAAVHALGIKMHLDDFGTGFSSLSYLHRFPFDVIKLDRSFCITMRQSETQRELVRNIICLAHALKLRVVAEGIDALEDVDLLCSFGCDMAQGFLFSRPLECGAVEDLLRQPRRLPAGVPQDPPATETRPERGQK